MLCRPPFRPNLKPVPRDFPVSLDLHYEVLQAGGPEIRDRGRTLWMSSREIVFETDRKLPPGTELEITIAWPAMLDQQVGLQLSVRAYVAHSLQAGVTATIRRYQFRTRSQAKAGAMMSAATACYSASGA